MARHRKDKDTAPADGRRYITPRELAHRWSCSRSTVDRIAAREGLTRLCLGEGRNGLTRFLFDEIEMLEQERFLKS